MILTRANLLSADPHNFDDIQPYVMNSVLRSINFPIGANYPLVLGNVSNNGLITMGVAANTMLYDISNKHVIWHSSQRWNYLPAVSADGKFLTVNAIESWVYEISVVPIKKIRTNPPHQRSIKINDYPRIILKPQRGGRFNS